MNEYEPNLKLQNLVNEPKKNNNKTLFILIGVIVLLIFIIFIMSLGGKKVVEREVEKKQSLDEISTEIRYFIDINRLDALDAFGYDNLARVAISKICYGVDNCTSIQGDAVKEYIYNVFGKEVTFSNINCELGDGVIYTYNSESNKFVFTGNHAHGGIGSKPIYTKVNSIKRKGEKIELVLNKLYYNPERTDYITTDPFGVNRVYNSKAYMHTVENGEDVDLTKLSANYENNFDELKNVGTRYRYLFNKKDGHYVLEEYEIITDEE